MFLRSMSQNNSESQRINPKWNEKLSSHWCIKGKQKHAKYTNTFLLTHLDFMKEFEISGKQ